MRAPASAWGIAALIGLAAGGARAEDGYDLWLRYRPLPGAQQAVYRSEIRTLVGTSASPTLEAAREELARGLGGLLGQGRRTASPGGGRRPDTPSPNIRRPGTRPIPSRPTYTARTVPGRTVLCAERRTGGGALRPR